MAETRKAPERAHVLILKLGADTREDLAGALHVLASDVERGVLTEGCYGSYSSGALYSYRVRPEQTHAKWSREMEEWLEAEAAKDARAAEVSA
ncbi:hypothetical protein [Afifella sp. IM 167]|uniref:hypothetical protein n=1 Tax=Afifella sp. IM 167 TaxID=2033586 RepID=UPI001CC90586|nr:hypothetical protein [Afifella sp. IM 167]MBZ8133243.1 hypothetical protein [Afifella sp. IM 167]